jgi:hypothetical protein
MSPEFPGRNVTGISPEAPIPVVRPLVNNLSLVLVLLVQGQKKKTLTDRGMVASEGQSLRE